MGYWSTFQRNTVTGKVFNSFQMFDFSNKNILITGAGSGIGQKTAKTLSKLGANLILVDLNEDGLKETKNLVEGKAQTVTADLCDFEELPTIVKEIHETVGILHGLVHCAGISSRKPLKVLNAEGFSKVMNVNFYAFEELVRLFAKRGYFADGGSIVVMSSISAVKGYKAKTEYCVSKAAVDAFVRCMAVELAPRRIRINSVMAAEVLTPLALKAKELNQSLGAQEFTSPLGPTDPYEIANTITFLLSDATKTISGTALVIDRGAMIV